MLTSLLLPIGLSAVALFFASFLSWMVLQLHKPDWKTLPAEEDVLAALRPFSTPAGNYMFPMAGCPKEQQSPEFAAKWKAGPAGVVTFFPTANMDSPAASMGPNLGMTFAYFLFASFCLAYLGTLALPGGAGFMPVFRFMSTAAFLTFFSAMVPHAIWFKVRIVGHLIESIAFAAIVGAIFGAMWPS